MAGFRPGRGRGRGYIHQALDMWEAPPGRAPFKTRIKPDPVTGCYKLHVKSIPSTWNKEILYNTFSNVGEPTSLYLSPKTGQSSFTWAFVEFQTFEEAAQAIRHLNNKAYCDFIEITFARERVDVEDDIDINFEKFDVPHHKAAPESDNKTIQSVKKYSKTIMNDQKLETTIPLDKRLSHAEEQKLLEEGIVKNLQFLKDCPERHTNCVVCFKPSLMSCEACGDLYCSNECLDKDLPNHSKYCTPSLDLAKSNSRPVFNGRNERNTSNRNSYSSDEVNKSTRGSENSYNNDNNRYNRSRPSRFGENDRGAWNRGKSNNRNAPTVHSNESERNMFEERKSRYFSDKVQTEVKSGSRSDVKVEKVRHNIEIESPSSEKTDLAPIFKKPASSTASSVGTPPASQKPTVNGLESSTSTELKPGVEKNVIIVDVQGPGFFHTTIENGLMPEDLEKIAELGSSTASFTSSFVPVEKGVCVANYDDCWCRCQVMSLDPLTVKYLDYGNTEILTADRLFTLPDKLAAIPPLAVTIKLDNGTPPEFLDKQPEDKLSIIPIKKVKDYWVVQVAGVVYPQPPTEPKEPVSQIKQEAAVPVFPHLLPAEVFTEVCVRHVDVEYLAVTPVAKMAELEEFSARLQSAALKASTITPTACAKCLAFCPVNKTWYRGYVVQLNPLHVKFVDTGIIQTCNPEDVREIPSDFTSAKPFVVFIKPNKGSLVELSKMRRFSVKPLRKEPSGSWVVEVATPESHEVDDEDHTFTNKVVGVQSVLASPALVSQPPTSVSQILDKIFPSFLNKDTFSPVMITVKDPDKEGADKGTYYVLSEVSLLSTLTEYSHYFLNLVRTALVSPKIGEIGLALYDDIWYRVKVINLTPLQVFYMDYGNTEVINSDQLFVCPDSHKHVPPLGAKVKLAPGTNKKYYNLPEDSRISVKPVSMLPGGVVLVEIEGEDYNDSSPDRDVKSSPAAELKSSPAAELKSSPAAELKSSPASELQSLSADTSSLNSVDVTQVSHVMDLLAKGYEMEILVTKIDVARNMVFGTLYGSQLPDILQDLVCGQDLNSLLASEPYDPKFMPTEGELVACKHGEYQRAQVLQTENTKWFSLVDQSIIVKYEQCKRLPQQFASLPHMGVVLTLSSSNDTQLLKKYEKDASVPVTVMEVGSAGCVVQVADKCYDLKAKLVKWNYDPLVWPLPLSSGDLVTISKVINSRTLVVTLDDENVRDEEQIILIECMRNNESFENPPQVGEYVVVKKKEEEPEFYRGRIEDVDSNNMIYSLFAIDSWLEEREVSLDRLKPMAACIRKIPCRTMPVVLKDVKMIESHKVPELAKKYIETLVDKNITLRIELDQEVDLVTLIKDNNENVNEKLELFLTQEVLPDSSGKFTYESLIYETPQLNELVSLMVTHSDPLHMQILERVTESYNLMNSIKEYATSENALYNPCANELCFVEYEEEWYRAICLRETNEGFSYVKLLDYGNIMSIPTSKIRRARADFFTLPIFGLRCKFIGLPRKITPELQARLSTIFGVDKIFHGASFTSLEEEEGERIHLVSIPEVLTTLRNEGLLEC